jgi:hypothetical protein
VLEVIEPVATLLQTQRDLIAAMQVELAELRSTRLPAPVPVPQPTRAWPVPSGSAAPRQAPHSSSSPSERPQPRPSYADRLRASVASATTPEEQARAAARCLTYRPMHERMVRHSTPLRSDFQARVDQVTSVFARGITRTSFTDLRRLLALICPTLRQETLLAISYAGPLTELVCSTSEVADTLSSALEAAGIRLARDHDPTVPLATALRDDPAARAAAQTAYITRMGREISRTPSLLVATYFQRRVPDLMAEVSAAVSPGGSRMATQPPRSTPSAAMEGGTA